MNVDREVVNAIRPAQATFPRSKLIKISSFYSKQGELYRDFASRGSRPNLLCFRAATWEMNPTVPEDFLRSEREHDPAYFEREYAAQFTDDISTVFSREAVEACIVGGRYELPRVPEFEYSGTVDPSGGGPDEFALSVCHSEDGIIVQDCIRRWRSHRPTDVVREAASLLKSYGLEAVVGDRYSAEWVRQSFKDQNIRYDVAELTASDAFLELLPLVNQGTIELLDDARQTAQLISLERRKGRSGKDSLGHPAGGHDDRANALALASFVAKRQYNSQLFFI